MQFLNNSTWVIVLEHYYAIVLEYYSVITSEWKLEESWRHLRKGSLLPRGSSMVFRIYLPEKCNVSQVGDPHPNSQSCVPLEDSPPFHLSLQHGSTVRVKERLLPPIPCHFPSWERLPRRGVSLCPFLWLHKSWNHVIVDLRNWQKGKQPSHSHFNSENGTAGKAETSPSLIVVLPSCTERWSAPN